MTHRFLENSADQDHASQSQPFASDFDAMTDVNSGVVSGCTPTANGTGLGVNVASGVVVVNGAVVSVSPSTPAVTLTAADGTNPRVDLVHVNSSGTVAKTDGTAASSPVAPALPANVVLLAEIHLPASTTTLANTHVSDKIIVIPDPRVAIEYSGAQTLDWDDDVVNVDTSGGAVTITLPDNATYNGKAFIIRRDGASNVVINRAGSDTFDDAATSKTLGSDGAGIGIISIGDGEWKIVSTTGTVT